MNAAALPRRLRRLLLRARAARAERHFRASLRFAPDAPALVLSPHLDDAVLDCWSLLATPEQVRVVNVCAGIPPAGSVTLWDEITGASDSAGRVRERVAEDATALALAGREPVNLPFFDLQYRTDGRSPALAAIDRAVVAVTAQTSHVYAPAAIGGHPDHRLVRGYARALARAGVPVSLYADLPYCVMHGWPAWVDGRPVDPHRDVDASWRSFLAGVPEVGDVRAGEVIRLDDAAAAAKLAAMRAYATQLPALDYGARGLLADPEIHRYEVRWRLSAPTSGAAGNASPR